MRRSPFMLLALLLGASSCSDAELDAEDRKLARMQITPKHKDPAAINRELTAKLQPYVKCINTGAASVTRSRRRYLSWIHDPKVGPTCKERYIYAPYRLYSTYNCKDKLVSANGKTPHLERLEKAAKSFATAVGVLEKLLSRAYTYYNTRAYRADKCALGQKLHPQLMAAFRAANAADKVMRERVGHHNNLIMQRRLTQLQATYGTNHPRYHRRKVLSEAKKLWVWIDLNGARKDTTAEMVAAAIASYEKVYNKMQAGPSSGAGYGYSSFKSAAKSYLDATKEYLDRRRTNKPYSRLERRWLGTNSAWLVKGSVARVLRRYNDLVNRYNAVRFR